MMDCSATIVRLVKRRAPGSVSDQAVRVIGIDDWAWQKGQHHFDTIFVDLQHPRVVDVLAVRTADAAGVRVFLAAEAGRDLVRSVCVTWQSELHLWRP